MRVLFDHGTPSGIARSLSGHDVTEAIERGWDRISNGELLKVAEAARGLTFYSPPTKESDTSKI
jgi:hypothetical protein